MSTKRPRLLLRRCLRRAVGGGRCVPRGSSVQYHPYHLATHRQTYFLQWAVGCVTISFLFRLTFWASASNCTAELLVDPQKAKREGQTKRKVRDAIEAASRTVGGARRSSRGARREERRARRLPGKLVSDCGCASMKSEMK